MSTCRMLCLIGAVVIYLMPALAQITIHVADLAPIGTQAEYHVQDTASFSVGSSGANRVWTFEDYDWDQVGTVTSMAPEQTPYGYLFPDANAAIQFGEMYIYNEQLPVGVYRIGVASATDTAIYSQYPVELVLPLTYQASWTSVARWADYAPGWQRMDSTQFTIDGWGTLETPYFSGPVLRKFMHRWSTFGQIGQPPQWSAENVGYHWVSQTGFPMAEVWSRDGVLDPNFTQGLLGMSSIITAADPPRGPVARTFAVRQNYPNPFNPETRIPVDLERAGLTQLKIYDQLGRLTYSREIELPAGSNELIINSSSWSAGSYYARVSRGSDVNTIRMSLLK
ncbi:T9SS type A sorting domain-containing protein [candidate division KSB1 bacterium]|nr:T9SS type A sorting domain-containing protein [candidate division KSB1 bacterium]